LHQEKKKSTPYPEKREKKWEHSFRSRWGKDISNCQSHYRLHQYLITIHCYLSQILSRTLELKRYIWRWTYGEVITMCHIQVHLSRKLHPRGDATSEPYKPTFHGGHLSRNTSYGGTVTLQVFRLPWQRYSYSTQSSMMELLLSVSQHWNLHSGQ